MAFTQYNATGKVIDLTKLITMISPSDTPLVSLIGTGSPCKQVLHSWEKDTLPSPADNAKVEGFSYTVEDPGETTLLDNVCQIMARGYGITDTNKATERYNIKDKLAYEMRKAMKLLALDEERAIIRNKKKVLGNATTPRKMAGIQYYLQTNVLGNNGTPRPLTYGLLNDALERIYGTGGDPKVIVASARNKRVLSMLLPLSTDRSQKADSKKIVATIDVFEGDFGTQRVMTDRWMTNDQIFILSPEYLKMCFLRPFSKKELPKTKSAQEQIIEGELTLEVRAEEACGRIVDLDGVLPTA